MSEPIETTQRAQISPWREVGIDIAQALRFYSRLPVPALPWEDNPHALPDFSRLTRVVPLAGLVLGLLPALVLTGALRLDLGPWLAAILAVGIMTLTTGAFHEDGLADTADSCGGVTRERRLEIMRDSRIGSFGAAALFLALALRITTLATLILRTDAIATAAAILVTASLSRTAGLIPLVFLPPARLDGASYAVGQPSREGLWFATGLAIAAALALSALGGLPVSGLFLMIAFSALCGYAMTLFSRRHIQGQTGDIAGATQQLAEIAALIGLLTVIGT